MHKASLKAVIGFNASLHINLQFSVTLMTQQQIWFRLTCCVMALVRNSLTPHCN